MTGLLESTFALILFVTGQAAQIPPAPIYGFRTEQECNSAGVEARSLTLGTNKSLTFVCVMQSKETGQ